MTGCDVTFSGGDVDFDGTPYWADWPTSTTPGQFPSTFLQQAPSTVGGGNYPQFQFQTDVALSELTCSGAGSGCAVPPPAAPGAFYPYWTRSSPCTWEFGNMPNGTTFGNHTEGPRLQERPSRGIVMGKQIEVIGQAAGTAQPVS